MHERRTRSGKQVDERGAALFDVLVYMAITVVALAMTTSYLGQRRSAAKQSGTDRDLPVPETAGGFSWETIGYGFPFVALFVTVIFLVVHRARAKRSQMREGERGQMDADFEMPAEFSRESKVAGVSNDDWGSEDRGGVPTNTGVGLSVLWRWALVRKD